MSNLDGKIEEIKVKIYELQKDLASIMHDVAKSKWSHDVAKSKWSPVGCNWFINQCDDAVEEWNMSNEETKQAGLERPTQQQADRAFIEMRKFNRLLALRDELCGNELYDKSRSKYFIFFNTEHKKWHSTHYLVSDYVTPCFTTQESSQRACNMLNSGEVEL